MAKSNKQTEPETAGMAAMLDANPMAKAWMAMMSESTRFVTERFRRDIEMQQAILACRNPADLMKLQSEFYAKAMAQYMEEATKMFEMMSEVAKSSAEGMSLSTKRGYDDVPL